MAVIVQADPYQSLIRKIGYSVGLENLVERVKKLVSLYVRDRAIGAVAFRDLVEKDFRRKNAVEHFANFYGTLNLIRVIVRDQVGGLPNQVKRPGVPKTLEPMYQLDSLSILRRIFETDDIGYDKALKVVLTQGIVEADGDIFLNALLSDFQPLEMRGRLESMVHTKRRLLRGVMRTQWAKIEQIVDIKNESGPGANVAEEAAPQGRFGRRTQPLGSSRRTSPLTQTTERAMVVPADYLDKVSVTRKGWAEDLGWFAEGRKTEQGEHLLEALEGNIISVGSTPTTALFWGYRSDLERMRLKPSDIEARDCEAWDLLSAIASAYCGTERLSRATIQSVDEVVSLLQRIFDLYKEGNATRGLIRNSLPLYIAEPVLAGWCVAEGRQLPDLGAILEAEYKKKVRRVQKMIIRGTAGALFFSR
jgi:hypothetical protein